MTATELLIFAAICLAGALLGRWLARRRTPDR